MTQQLHSKWSFRKITNHCMLFVSNSIVWLRFLFRSFYSKWRSKKVDKQQNWISVAAIFSRHSFHATTTTTPNHTANWIITFIWCTYCSATCFPVVIEYHFIRSFRLTNKHVIYVYILHTLWYDRRLHRAVTAFFSVLRLISLPSYERQ